MSEFFVIPTFYFMISLIEVDNMQVLSSYNNGWVGRLFSRGTCLI